MRGLINMADYVKENTCGTCKYYEYAGQNKKGYCTWHKSYYYHDDTCNHYIKSDSYNSGSSGCFLTTACCEYKGLADNCYELETIRRLRDKYIVNQPYGEEMIRCYYKEAPIIVENIRNSEDSAVILEYTYNTISKIVKSIENGNNDEAIILYMMLFHNLSNI